MSTPEQDHPDRLAEIKQRAMRCPPSFRSDTEADLEYLIGEVERLRAERGSTPPVFREGDPKPGRPMTILDREGDVGWHDPGAPDWDLYLRAYGPVVEIVMPDYAAAVAADEAARALTSSALPATPDRGGHR